MVREMYTSGAIFWLPPKSEIPTDHLMAASYIDEGCFNHPVLVLSADHARTEVVVLMITSLGGKDLLQRHPRDVRVRSIHLPIYPSNTHPENGKRLFLANDERLSKNSYVILKPCRTIRAVLLRQWKRRRNIMLREDSMRELIKHISFESPWPQPVHVYQPVLVPRPAAYTLPNLEHNHAPPHLSHTPSYLGHKPVTPQLGDNHPRLLLNESHTRTLFGSHHTVPHLAYNHTTQPISARSSYHVPVQWTSPQDRRTHVYSGRERTPLLDSEHGPVQRRESYGDESPAFEFMIFLVIVALLAGLFYWYISIQ